MAKNLLHTYTRYSNAYIDESFIGRLRADLNASSIGKLRAKETQLYAKYGASSFEEFRQRLKSVHIMKTTRIEQQRNIINYGNRYQAVHLSATVVICLLN